MLIVHNPLLSVHGVHDCVHPVTAVVKSVRVPNADDCIVVRHSRTVFTVYRSCSVQHVVSVVLIVVQYIVKPVHQSVVTIPVDPTISVVHSVYLTVQSVSVRGVIDVLCYVRVVTLWFVPIVGAYVWRVRMYIVPRVCVPVNSVV